MLGYLHFLRGEADASARAFEASLGLNPNHANLLGGAAFLLALVDKWERALSLIQKAMHLNPHHPGWYHFVPSFNQYRQRNYEAALEGAFRINSPGFFLDPLFRAAVFGQLGRQADAKAAWQELLEILPDFPTMGREVTHRFLASNEYVEILWDGLRKAGLEDTTG